MNKSIIGTAAVLALVGMTANSQAQMITNYSEDFNGFAVGPIFGQSGWTTSANGGVDIIQNTPGNMSASGTGSFGESKNDGLILTADTQSVVLEWTTRSRASLGFQSHLKIANAGQVGLQHVLFLATSADGYVLNGNSGFQFTGNIAGDDALSNNHHRWYEHRVSYNFESGLGLWEVSHRDGDGLYTPITSFNALQLGGLINQPSAWNTLAIGLIGSPDRLDDIRITSTLVPAPSTAVLMGLGGLGMRRRRRR